MRIVVIGCGYVGLVSGSCFAEMGNDVTCVDTDALKVASLNSGRVPIYERGLNILVTKNVAAGRLRFVSELPALGSNVDAVFIAVGTPPLNNGQGADLTHIFAAVHDIAEKAERRVLIVTKSTVPSGTGDAIEQLLQALRPDLCATVASNPEFLREGNAIDDFLEPDRIVIGTEDDSARETLRALYAPMQQADAPILCMSRRAAEITKYASNAFLAIKVTFINEIADLCEAVDADIDEVARGVGTDRRIGSAFLQAGPGYGGSCFPKDTAALLATAHDHAVGLRLVEGAIIGNEARKRSMGRRVVKAMGGDCRGKLVAVLGLTFKANTDDVRDSPAITLVTSLLKSGAKVRVYDPEGIHHLRTWLPDATWATDIDSCVENADCVVLATEWDEFQRMDIARLAGLVRARVFVDLRNVMNKTALVAQGFTVHGIGRVVDHAKVRNEIVKTPTLARKRQRVPQTLPLS